MGQKGAGQAKGFAKRVIESIDAARTEAEMTKVDLIRESGVPANTFHKKMRGEIPFNLNEIEKLAKGMKMDAMLILQRASDVGALDETPTPSADRDVADIITERQRRQPSRSTEAAAARTRKPGETK